ncbi:MAG: c-type cytochrome [Xanthobacteraceae bacterium]
MRSLSASGRWWNVARVVVTVVLLVPTSRASLAQEKLGPLERHGRALAERMCSRCHAIGRSGSSPHRPAPPFRALENRVDLDSFTARLREGLISGHPDMPVFRFTREDARALTAYLRAIQGP